MTCRPEPALSPWTSDLLYNAFCFTSAIRGNCSPAQNKSAPVSTFHELRPHLGADAGGIAIERVHVLGSRVCLPLRAAAQPHGCRIRTRNCMQPRTCYIHLCHQLWQHQAGPMLAGQVVEELRSFQVPFCRSIKVLLSCTAFIFSMGARIERPLLVRFQVCLSYASNQIPVLRKTYQTGSVALAG